MPSLEETENSVLPAEIMLMIFFCILRDAEDRAQNLLILSHLNTPLRQLVLAVSSFWSSISITSSSDGSQELARLFILRSGLSPLDLTIGLGNRVDVESILGGHVSRIRSLSVSPGTQLWIQVFFLFMCRHPMPLLETIEELCDCGGIDRFGIVIPSAEWLHSITLSGTIPKYLTPPQYNHVRNLQFESDNRWLTSQIVPSILLFPGLERLSFRSREKEFIIATFDWDWESPILCEELRELSFTYTRTQFISWALEVFRAPNLETVEMTEPENDHYQFSVVREEWSFPSVRSLSLLQNIRSRGELPEPYMELLVKRFPNITHLQLSIHRTQFLGVWKDISLRKGRTLWEGITSLQIVDEPKDDGAFEASLEEIASFIQWFKAITVVEVETRAALDTERGRSLLRELEESDLR